METSKDKRILSVDIIRIIACYLVIVNHTIPEYIIYKEPSFEWFTMLTIFQLSRIAVPLFVIITGYNMLGKKTEYKDAFKKAFRFFLVLLFFSIVYYVKDIIMNGREDAGIKEFCLLLTGGGIWNTLWYLYLYIMMMVSMPFLQKMVSKFKRKDFYVCILIALVISSIVPTIEYLVPDLNFVDYGMADLFSLYMLYLLIGYYIKKYNYILIESKRANLILFILSVIANIILTYLEYLKVDSNNFFYYSNLYAPTIVVGAVSFFRLLHDVKINDKFSKCIGFMSSITLAVYLIADIFIDLLIFIRTGLYDNGFPAFLACFIYRMAVIACSVVVAVILKKIPGLKKIL